MGFASPTSNPGDGVYVAIFAHTNGEQISIQSVRQPSGPFDPTHMDTAWSAAVALLDASADFTYVGGDKQYQTTEIYTP